MNSVNMFMTPINKHNTEPSRIGNDSKGVTTSLEPKATAMAITRHSQEEIPERSAGGPSEGLRDSLNSAATPRTEQKCLGRDKNAEKNLMSR